MQPNQLKNYPVLFVGQDGARTAAERIARIMAHPFVPSPAGAVDTLLAAALKEADGLPEYVAHLEYAQDQIRRALNDARAYVD